jgi:hypothetical protein
MIAVATMTSSMLVAASEYLHASSVGDSERAAGT